MGNTLLITGGAGFIGSNLVHHAIEHTSHRIVVIDKLTYAGSLSNLEGILDDAWAWAEQVRRSPGAAP